MLISILVKIICDFGGQNNYWDFVRPNNHWDFVGKNNHCDFVVLSEDKIQKIAKVDIVISILIILSATSNEWMSLVKCFARTEQGFEVASEQKGN